MLLQQRAFGQLTGNTKMVDKDKISADSQLDLL